MDCLDVLQKLDSILDELLDILKAFKEQHEALLDVLQITVEHVVCSTVLSGHPLLRKTKINSMQGRVTDKKNCAKKK